MKIKGPHETSQWIKTKAKELGFDACGIAKAEYLQEDAVRLEEWLTGDYHGEMGYMSRNIGIRTDPRELLPGARSVVSVLLNYFPEETLPVKDNYKIARYAYGKDYHFVIRDQLRKLISELKAITVDFQARAFTDSAPALERAWADKAGLGWIGKNTCLIHPELGSFVFLGEIITDLELEYDHAKVNDLCGGCTRCIDTCPTGAITAPRRLDARKCISYLTIEYHGELPVVQKEKFGNWIFGCDICQEVCPWNRKAKPHNVSDFLPNPELIKMDKSQWEELEADKFATIFKNSAVKRTKFEGLKRNIIFLKNNENQD